MVEALALRPITAEALKSTSERKTREVTREDVLWLSFDLILQQHVKSPSEHYAVSRKQTSSSHNLRKTIKEELGIRRFIATAEVDSICAQISAETGVYPHQTIKIKELTESLLPQEASKVF